MPIEINLLRAYKGGDPDKFREYQRARFRPVEWVDDVLQADEEWRNTVAKKDNLRKAANKFQKEVIAPMKKAKQSCEAEVQKLKQMQEEINHIDKVLLPQLASARDRMLARLGNVVDPEVPVSNDEDKDNAVCRLFPMPSGVSLPCPQGTLEYQLPASKPMKHDDLLWRIGGYEPERGGVVAGHRGYFLTNAGVLLNQALINYAIAFLRAKEFDDGKRYDVLQPPYMMNKELMNGIAQLEDYDEQLYKVSGKTDDPSGSTEKYLIATSEQPICAYHKDEWLEEKDLPKRYAGVSTCFRKEAGSSGRDIRGIFRVHQFEKVEQFVLCKDDFEESQKMQKQMLANAEEFYQSLGLPYRVVTIVSAELNDAAVKKYDLEAWFPGQEAYRELVSCSNCTDYQARAMGIRCGTKKMNQTSASYVHMLNSTLCATGRGICCLLENWQTENGVVVPEVLRPYMGGIDFLPFVREARALSKAEIAQKKQEESQRKQAAKADDKKQAVAAEPAKAASAPATAGGAEGIVQQINAKGEEIRELKKNKATKDTIMAHVAELNALKAKYEEATGTPFVSPNQQGSSKKKKKGGDDKEQKQQPAKAAPAPATAGGAEGIVQQINAKGEEIRELKKNKATKDTIMAHVAELNALKAKYEEATGTPFVSPNQQGSSKKKKKGGDDKEQKQQPAKAAPAPATAGGAEGIVQQINAKGEEIRELKKNKATKDTIMAHVAELNALKAKYEEATGTPFVSPNQQGSSKKKKKGGDDKEQKQQPAKAAPAPATAGGAEGIVQQINAKGEEIRELKKNKATKDTIMAHVAELNALKAKYEEATGTPFVSPNQQGSSKKKKKGGDDKEQKQQPAKEQKQKPAKQQKQAVEPKPSKQAPQAKSAVAAPLDLEKLNDALTFQSYVSGFTPSKDDAVAYDALAGVMSVNSFGPQHANVKRWFSHMASFTAPERAGWGGVQTVNVDALKLTPLPVTGTLPPPPPVVAAVAAPASKGADDDMDDLFGDDDEEETKPSDRAQKAKELKAKRDAELEERKAAAQARLQKKEANQRSLCNLEIKPWEAEQDLMDLFKRLKSTVQRDGLKWSENCALKDVAFGIKKIILTAVISQNISMDAIIEEITEEVFPDEIQSMEMTSMSLL